MVTEKSWGTCNQIPTAKHGFDIRCHKGVSSCCKDLPGPTRPSQVPPGDALLAGVARCSRVSPGVARLIYELSVLEVKKCFFFNFLSPGATRCCQMGAGSILNFHLWRNVSSTSCSPPPSHSLESLPPFRHFAAAPAFFSPSPSRRNVRRGFFFSFLKGTFCLPFYGEKEKKTQNSLCKVSAILRKKKLL